MALDLALLWDDDAYRADLALSGADLLTDPGLRTAVIASLLTDRLAEPGDALPEALPDGGADRRGWWGDLPLPDAADPPDGLKQPDRIGSRLWLLARAKQVPETLRQAEAYAQESLAWMTADRVAGSVAVAASWTGLGAMALEVTLTRAGSAARYAPLWDAAAPQPSGVLVIGILLRTGAPLLARAGNPITLRSGA